MTDIAAIILAAGRSARFMSVGGSGHDASDDCQLQTKMTALFKGRALVRYAAETALGIKAHPVCIITGHARASVMAALSGLAVAEVHNAHYASGIASSLIAGIAALPLQTKGAFILLGDMPMVKPDLCRRLMAAFADAADVDAVVPAIDGRRGNPVLLSRKIFSRVRTLTGDQGARPLLTRADAIVLEVPVDDSGAGLDIDTREALKALEDPLYSSARNS